jgi:hypothetical protein
MSRHQSAPTGGPLRATGRNWYSLYGRNSPCGHLPSLVMLTSHGAVAQFLRQRLTRMMNANQLVSDDSYGRRER